MFLSSSEVCPKHRYGLKTDYLGGIVFLIVSSQIHQKFHLFFFINQIKMSKKLAGQTLFVERIIHYYLVLSENNHYWRKLDFSARKYAVAELQDNSNPVWSICVRGRVRLHSCRKLKSSARSWAKLFYFILFHIFIILFINNSKWLTYLIFLLPPILLTMTTL